MSAFRNYQSQAVNDDAYYCLYLINTHRSAASVLYQAFRHLLIVDLPLYLPLNQARLLSGWLINEDDWLTDWPGKWARWAALLKKLPTVCARRFQHTPCLLTARFPIIPVDKFNEQNRNKTASVAIKRPTLYTLHKVITQKKIIQLIVSEQIYHPKWTDITKLLNFFSRIYRRGERIHFPYRSPLGAGIHRIMLHTVDSRTPFANHGCLNTFTVLPPAHTHVRPY